MTSGSGIPTSPRPGDRPAAAAPRSRQAARPAGAPRPTKVQSVAVGPGTIHAFTRVALFDPMEPQPYPVQHDKVQGPPVPDDTLPRARLLDWLSAKAHSRLVLVVADAGYGKTTLLGDWTRRSRLPVAWYRLDESDADWTGFIHHLLAAVRGVDPRFGTNTRSVLREAAAGLADRAAVVRALLGEFGGFRAPVILILDDYHAVDAAPEVRAIVRELVLRGPERLSVIISSRRRPSLPLARLRALGEIADLGTDDLRFDHDEIEQLFRDAYHDPLEGHVLDQVAATTEGWAATLRLIEAAIRDRPRTEVSRVIRSLAARHGDLHDYLAEEVVGRLPAPIAAFLERVALLDAVTPELAAAAADVDPSQVRSLLEQAEASGLLPRHARTDARTTALHPLVRSFLEARLRDEVGDSGVRAIHARIARAAPPQAWQVAARHHGAAGEPDAVAATLDGAIGDILGQGAYQLAGSLAGDLSIERRGAWYDILQARQLMQAGDLEAARAAATKALDGAHRLPASTIGAFALLTLSMVEYRRHEISASFERAQELMSSTNDAEVLTLADAMTTLISASVAGNLDACRATFMRVLDRHAKAGYRRYEGIGLLDIAWIDRARGDAAGALRAAEAAIEALTESSSYSDIPTARAVLGWARLYLGQIEDGLASVETSLSTSGRTPTHEALCEAADVIGELWDVERSQVLLADAIRIGASGYSELDYRQLLLSDAAMRVGDPVTALERATAIAPRRLVAFPAFEARRLLTVARAQLLAGWSADRTVLDQAIRLATEQGAVGHARAAVLVRAVADGGDDAAREVAVIAEQDPALLSVNAEVVLLRLAEYPEAVLGAMEREVALRPRRWLPALRRLMGASDPRSRLRAAELIERHGEAEDVARLRALSRELKGAGRAVELGRDLSRRLAARVFVEDQGRVVIQVGDRVIPGTDVRRKALALLCFLLSRDGFAATRDQVLEALWPDLEPSLGTNSLHQTVYFLRRVFEPDFSDDLSPGYIHQSSELVWLDAELVASRSARCRSLFDALPAVPSPDQVDEVVELYRGRFALDFMYEDWAAPVRETLHARYRAIVERAVVEDGDCGQADRALRVAQRALTVDPELDEVEHSLLKLYRLAGAHAAAAEQYDHYAAALREGLGVDPPALDDL